MWINKSLSKNTKILFPPSKNHKTSPFAPGREVELFPQSPDPLYTLMLPVFYP